jgi:polyvinyl alcohol dehydrogenase (cytochrome)
LQACAATQLTAEVRHLDGTNMYALNGATGAILWSFAGGGSVAAGPAIVGGSVYWGSGYSKSGSGSASRRLYAFRAA